MFSFAVESGFQFTSRLWMKKKSRQTLNDASISISNYFKFNACSGQVDKKNNTYVPLLIAFHPTPLTHKKSK